MSSCGVFPPIGEADLDHSFQAVGAAGWSALAGRRIFITGGTGFIGKWLLSTLINADCRIGLGCELTVLSRDPVAFIRSAPHLADSPRVTIARGDVRNFEFPESRFDLVIHGATDVVASKAPLETFLTCVEGTRRTLEFAKRCGAREFLLTSSGAVYGKQPANLNVTPESYPGGPDPLLPSSAYGEGKRVSEWLTAVLGAQAGMSIKIARIYAQIGPYLPLDSHFAIGNFLRDAMAGKEIIIEGDGTAYRSYLHAADTAAWLWAMVIRGQSGSAYNVGGEEALTIAALAARVRQVLESSASIRVLRTAPPGHIAERYVPDVSRAREELKVPVPISLDDAIYRTARWHQERRSAQ
jgi:nucleoside-diphosphate-sugar epimerase